MYLHKPTFAACGWVTVALLLLCAAYGQAQVTVGDNLWMRMNGSAGLGYSGGFGNFARSSHGFGFSFDGLMNGYYFNPKFINFDVRPYYDRTQSNSDFQSIVRGTGINGSVNFFGDSHFPGSVSFGKDYSMNSEYQIVGIPSVTADSSSQTLGITWSLLLPDKPTLTATYGIGSSDSSITGTSMDSTSSNRTLTVSSTYKLAGWRMFGNMSHYNTSFTTPEFLTGTAESRSSSGTNYSFTTQRSIPMNGSISFGWSHMSADNSDNNGSSGSSYSASAGITPGRLGLSSSFSYNTNASQTFAYSVLGIGASTLNLVDNEAKLYFLSNSASIFVGHGFSVIGHMSWRREDFSYASYSDTQYGGTLSYRYNHRWLGMFYASAGVVDTANKQGNAGAGITGTVGLDHRFGHWYTSADFNYMHDVQTLYSNENNSYMNYGGSIRRKLNPETYISAFYRGSHSGVSSQSGTANMSNSFGGSVSWKGYSFSGNYSASSGTAILTSNGTLVATPNGPLFTPDFVYFDAQSLGVSASKVFFRRLSLNAAYSQVKSSSQKMDGINTASGNRFSATARYGFRKLMFTGGYSRSSQEFSLQAGLPRVVNSYYGSVTRWFNIF